MAMKVGFICITLLCCCAGCIAAPRRETLAPPKSERAAFLFPWVPEKLMEKSDKPNHLDVQIARRLEYGDGTMRVLNHGKIIFTFAPQLSPVSIFQSDNPENNLASLWRTGGDGRWYLFIFSYSHGKVTKILDANSLLLPEFAYPDKGVIKSSKSFKDKNGKLQMEGGSYFRQRIIVANDRWVDRRDIRVRIPVTVDIYTWDEEAGRYRKRERVPWSQRLNRL